MNIFDKLKNYIKKDKSFELTSDEKEQQTLIIYDHIINELNQYEQELAVLRKLNKSKDDYEKIVEDKILSYIEENDEVLTIQNEYGSNIGMLAADLKLENIVLRSLDNPIASTQQNTYRENIGIRSACNRLERATLKALDNHEASLQCDEFGLNIGMMAANCEMENVVLKALDNKEACRHIDLWGDNLGIYCARERFHDATLKALDNEEMSTHINNTGASMAYLISLYGLKDCLKKVLLKYPETIESFSDGCSQQMRQDIQEIKAEIEQDKLIEENLDNNLEIENEQN